MSLDFTLEPVKEKIQPKRGVPSQTKRTRYKPLTEIDYWEILHSMLMRGQIYKFRIWRGKTKVCEVSI